MLNMDSILLQETSVPAQVGEPHGDHGAGRTGVRPEPGATHFQVSLPHVGSCLAYILSGHRESILRKEERKH